MTIIPASQSLKEKQRQEREELILQVAEDVLLEKGYYEASMEEIAARVGISKGTIYLHFRGKEELIIGIIQRDMNNFLLEIDTAVASLPTARAKLEAVRHLIYHGLKSKHTRLLTSIYNLVDMQRMLEKEGCLRNVWDGVALRVTTFLNEGKATGEFTTAISTTVMVRSFFTLFTQRSFDGLILGEKLTLNGLMEQTAQLYFNGIAATIPINDVSDPGK